jgi:glycosyltransferase involved in cell wall biosynthesis
MAKPKVTVFIPTYNGEKYLGDILEALTRQQVDFGFETLIIDSGSTDATLKIIADRQQRGQQIRLHTIPNSEYGHGKTRNLAAQMAHGAIVVYLSHDAVPAHDRWLHEMVRPFEVNDKIAGVMGKQIPRPHCIPLLKYEIQSVFRNFGPDFGTAVFYKDDFVKDQGTYDAICFYSDVNSAGRKEYLTSKLPYQDVRYAEDQLMGRDIIDNGYYKVYAARGSVIHSNDLSLSEYSSRLFDETLGLRKIGLPVAVPSRKLICKLGLKGMLKDTVRILRDGEYSRKRKLYWVVVNPLFHIEKWRGVRRAALADLRDSTALNKYSLEARMAAKKHG